MENPTDRIWRGNLDGVNPTDGVEREEFNVSRVFPTLRLRDGGL